MTPEEHKQRHVELHSMLDELVADFIDHTQHLPSRTTLMTFMEWVCRQSQGPDHEPKEVQT